MKRSGLIRTIVAIAMMLIGWLPSLAHDFEVDGIFYNKTSDNTVAVTYKGDYTNSYSNEYAGDVVIPSSVNCNGITYSVTIIGDSAFTGCYSLTSIEIPNSVISIGYGALSNCTDLTSIEIPNSVTSIGNYAFCRCESLTSIEIPNSVTSIGNSAFYSCDSLTSIEIPNSVTSIGSSAFASCYSLTSVVWNVKKCSDFSDPSNPFNNSPNITSFTFGNSVEYIPDYLCYQMFYLTNVVIPNGVTSIGDWAFSDCSSLTSIQIPNSVTSIGYGAFADCSSLTSIEIPNSVTSIGYYAFADCSGLTSVAVDADNTKYDSRNGCNAIIETASNTLVAGCQNTIIPNSVTSIGDYAFDGCTSLTSIEIPNSVTSIGDYAFYGCSRLTNIEIPNSVTSIGKVAFAECYSMTSIEVPNSVTSIGNYAFYYCSSLAKITCLAITPPTIDYDTFSNYNANLYVPAGCKDAYESKSYWKKFTNIIELESELEEGATFEYEGLTYKVIVKGDELAVIASENGKYSGDIVIPSSVDYIGITYSVTSIGDDAFFNSYSLITSIEIPNSITSIGNLAFMNCTHIRSIEIPNGVTSIGNRAFENCCSLGSIVIPNSITIISNSAFKDCSLLTDVTIGDSVTRIGEEVFHGCKNLTSIQIPNSVTSIGRGAFNWCTGLTSIVVDASNTIYDSRENCNAIIETAANKLIVGCSNSKIPNSITSIGESVFQDHKDLASIEIPNSVTSIGTYAFSGCNNLTKITCLAITPPTIKSGTFSNYSADLFVPAGCKEAYEAAEYWNNFTNIIELEPKLEEGATFEYEGLTYKVIVKGEELAVIASENGKYSGDIVIPSSVDYNGITYSVTSIEDGAFSDCSEITNVKIPQSVTSIGNSAFWGCTGLTTVIVPHFVLSIGDNAFAYCNGLTKVSIGFRVKSIGAHIFQNCPNLNSVYWLATDCSDFTDHYLAPFDDCVTYFYFGDTVEHIPASLCNGLNNLTSIEIPQSVTSVGDFAFNNCDNLTKITCLATTPPTITSDTFTKYSADLYVPAGCKEAYEAAEYWNKFTNIIEIEEPNVNLFIDDFAINAGETKELAINLTNEIAFTGFQVDLYLPDGLEIEQEDGDYIFELTDRKGSDHVITSGKQANGAIRILCFSTKLNEFSGSEGAIVKFRVTAANDFVGNYEINIKDIILAQTDESEYQLPATTTKVEARMLAKSITLDRTEVSLEATQTTTLLATILPDNTSVKTVVWTSSDEDVAVVDENGVVTAIAIGEATITATTTDGTNLSASCKVTVVPTLGDANNDAVINVTDIMEVASYILGNTPEGFVFEAADVTKDGKINIIDIVAIANIILSSETPDKTQLAARVARQTALGSCLFIDDTSIQEGETMQLAVNLTNDIAFSGFQADVKLPEGLELCQEDGEYMISLSDRKGSDHVLTSAMLPDGTIRILSYSMNLNDFAGADGALVYLTVKANQHFVGDYEISIDNITFTQADLTEYSLEPTVCRIAGTVGIEGIEAEQEAEYFNLQGLPVANPEKGGLYIIKRGNKVSKSVIK